MSGTGDGIGVVGSTFGSDSVREDSGGIGEGVIDAPVSVARVDSAMSGMVLEVENVEGGSSDCVGVCMLLEDV